MPNRAEIGVAYAGIERTQRRRNSTPQWGVVAILMWSLITGCILSLFAGVLGCRPYRSLPATIGNHTVSVDASLAQLAAGAALDESADELAAASASPGPITIHGSESLSSCGVSPSGVGRNDWSGPDAGPRSS